MELQDIAGRYLETGADLPAAKRTLKLVESALSQAARRQGKHGAAALLRVPRKRFQEEARPESVNAPPNLDEYRDEADPGNFYSEAELLDMYRAEYGALAEIEEPAATPAQLRRQERNLRLLKRKIQLINDLAAQISKPPVLDDLISGWFDQRVANKFAAASLETLADLILFMNHKGYRWYRAIPRLGEVTARRILSFLAGSDLSGSLSAYAMMPREKFKRVQAGGAVSTQSRQTPRDAIVPLEQINAATSFLNGTEGTNRALGTRNRLQADDDLAAINAWLGLYKDRENTERAYRKEAERLLLWSIYSKRKAFSSLSTEDVGEYAAFLKDPQPREVWVADKRYERFHPAWKPFVKSGLSRRSAAYAIQVLSTLCGWLIGQRYLDSNPFDGLPRMNAGNWQPISRSLSVNQWERIRSYLKGLPDDESGLRQRFLVSLAFGTGMRIHEMAKAVVADLRTYQFGSEPVWYLHILGKGGKEREVPLPTSVLLLLTAYFRARGHDFTTIQDLPGDIPLLSHLGQTQAALTTRSLDKIMKGVYGAVADQMQDEEPYAAEALRRASMHWMRHTHATHALQNNVQLKTVRDNLGHASLNTTSIYIHTEMADRHREMEAFVGSI